LEYHVHPKIRTGSAHARTLNQSSIGKIGIFWPISRRISEMVQDKTEVVCINRLQEVAHMLLISTKLNELG